MINAWWLAEAAFLAYAEPQFAEPRFRDAGLPEASRVSKMESLDPLEIIPS